MTDTRPVLLWFRRDFRFNDHPALAAAVATGRPVIPVFVHDECVEALGAAPKWRLGLAAENFDSGLRGIGSRLVFRRGTAADVLAELASETNAAGVFWSRAYDPASIERDTTVKQRLKEQGLEAGSFTGHLLFEPWTVSNKSGSFFKVYTPFWKTVRGFDVGEVVPRVTKLRAPENWPEGDRIDDWRMGAAMDRGAAVVRQHLAVGEDAALDRLHRFLDVGVQGYRANRDFPAKPATSRLSENLTCGEISPRQIWHAAQTALHRGAAGAEHFLKELVWREFAYHLVFHTPQILSENWRPEWDGFPWRGDNDDAESWRRGMTGEPLVDAGMREMYVTGTMHNRLRMVVGSYLTKHLLTDWRIGRDWFDDCLVDWDPAANAMGWQWVAGCGPDAAPYFRVFNPETQAEKFDADGAYRRRFLLGWNGSDHSEAKAFFDAVPRKWQLSPSAPLPKRRVGLSEGREAALAAYQKFRDVQVT